MRRARGASLGPVQSVLNTHFVISVSSTSPCNEPTNCTHHEWAYGAQMWLHRSSQKCMPTVRCWIPVQELTRPCKHQQARVLGRMWRKQAGHTAAGATAAARHSFDRPFASISWNFLVASIFACSRSAAISRVMTSHCNHVTKMSTAHAEMHST